MLDVRDKREASQGYPSPKIRARIVPENRRLLQDNIVMEGEGAGAVGDIA
jgi:hypothetical protein